MSWKDDMRLRDVDETHVIEATCPKCLHFWLEEPTHLLLKVDHRDVTLREVENNLACTNPYCTQVGVRIALIRNEDTSGFVAGMP